jgi:ubiquitin
MQQLQFHPSPVFHVDATPPPVALVRRVHALLSKRAFHVQAGNFEGMSYLDKLGATLTKEEGEHFATSLCLKEYKSSGDGLRKLHRLAEIINFHKEIVNTKLSRQAKGLYY